jgi:hypothetical protein
MEVNWIQKENYKTGQSIWVYSKAKLRNAVEKRVKKRLKTKLDILILTEKICGNNKNKP